MTIKTVIFDFDGTVINSLDEGLRIFNETAQKAGYKKIDDTNKELLRNKEIREVLQEVGIPLFHVPFIMMKGRKELSKKIAFLEPFSGVKEVLSTLRKRYMLGLVTSNSLANVSTFLQINNIDTFHYIETGSSMFGKGTRIKKLLKKYGISPHETVYIGDETRDIEAAKSIGAYSISVTWGLNTKEVLQRLQPNYIVDAPEEILQILGQQ
jgi:phosphoglycolate phosphatase